VLVNDVHADPRYLEGRGGIASRAGRAASPQGRVIGALNLLSDTAGQFTEIDEMILRQFGAHVAVALENARLFEQERDYRGTLEDAVGRRTGNSARSSISTSS